MGNDISALMSAAQGPQAAWPPPRQSVIGFSASREEPTEQRAEIILAAIAPLWKMRGFVTGACIGGDHRIATWLAAVYSRTPQIVIVPADRSRIARWWDQPPFNDPLHREPVIWIREMPPGSSYAERNDEILERSTVLVAFPAEQMPHPASARSGTWMTIRKALRRGMEVHIFPLDGSPPLHLPASKDPITSR